MGELFSRWQTHAQPQPGEGAPGCIDYVILHELCHLAEHNHSERFYRLMAQVMPQWRTIKVRLDEMANLLIEGDG
ncbi:hypothetical protein EHW99_3037 [Erwinia amylovora]|nr:M48 family peptidase [Erwinia amylovora]QJQ55736.1 hypothetical protein EHX00_3037 [Erwinia amylovora]QJQ59435.1 hypothetical protein EHW99_3037 [Erwinia amylovora]QJQ63134.1 hypothetical protein EHW98_3037 [Erwinia amylovora]QJQ66936.1 hypothetical protein EHW96_3037 [Erwinia amylovora]